MSTIVDLARGPSVSVSPVSDVVNRARLVYQTMGLLKEAVAFVAFRRDALASSFKRASTDSIGIAVSTVNNSWFFDRLSAVEMKGPRVGLMSFFVGYARRRAALSALVHQEFALR